MAIYDFKTKKRIDIPEPQNAPKSSVKGKYERLIGSMDKLELIQEMIKYNEERNRTDKLTPELITKGLILFKALAFNAETEKMRQFAISYVKHLEKESA